MARFLLGLLTLQSVNRIAFFVWSVTFGLVIEKVKSAVGDYYIEYGVYPSVYSKSKDHH